MRWLLPLTLYAAVLCFAAGPAAAQQAGVGASIGGQTTTQTSAGVGADGTATQAGVEASAGADGSAAAQPAASTTKSTTTPAATATTTEGQTENSAEVQMDAGTYTVRLRDLEQRVNELKEQIFRSKARLSLLAETVLQGVVAGAQARIAHENKMGNSYKLVKVAYALDGAPIFNKADESGELGDREKFDIYNGSIVPGEHTLTVQLEYRGHGYGIFSYLKGYRFKVSSSYTFTAPEGKATTVRVVGYEKGGPTAPLEERPAVRYVERVDSPEAPEVAGGGE